MWMERCRPLDNQQRARKPTVNGLEPLGQHQPQRIR
jgi:hypothetical protein